MPISNDFYRVSSYGDSLQPGEKLKLEHYISVVKDKVDISELIPLPVAELERRRAESVNFEQAIFKQIVAAVSKWEEQAAITMLLDRALEYCKVPACQHSANQWVANEHGDHTISNMTYQMTWRVYEDTRYDRAKGESIPVAWELSWYVHTNRRVNPSYTGGVKIAGQERKRYTDKSAMEKYLKGRIAAYSHLFTELSPPVPREHAKYFMVNGVLLPGYTIAENGAAQTGQVANGRRHTESAEQSVLGRIAEAREAQSMSKTESSEKHTPVRSTSRDPEL